MRRRRAGRCVTDTHRMRFSHREMHFVYVDGAVALALALRIEMVPGTLCISTAFIDVDRFGIALVYYTSCLEIVMGLMMFIHCYAFIVWWMSVVNITGDEINDRECAFGTQLKYFSGDLSVDISTGFCSCIKQIFRISICTCACNGINYSKVCIPKCIKFVLHLSGHCKSHYVSTHT